MNSQGCDLTVTEREQDGLMWTVEKSVDEVFYQHAGEADYWRNALRWVWIPDPSQPGPAIVAGLMGGPPEVASLDPAAVSAPLLVHRGGLGRCPDCGREGAVILGRTDQRGVVARLHTYPETEMPSSRSLLPNYPARMARKGSPVVVAGHPELDPLHCTGALVDNDGIHVLLADEDGKCRGWENVSSLGDLQEPRWAVRGYDLLVTGRDHSVITGFEEPAQVEDLSKVIRALSAKAMSQSRAALL